MPGQTSGVSKCSKCRRYCRLIATFLFSHIGLCALVVGYSIIGAFTFEALEAGHEKTKRQLMLKERENVVTNLWTLTSKSSVLSEHNWTTLATETLQDFEITLVKAVRKEGYDGKDESPLQWTFSGALLYSIIVITTIGWFWYEAAEREILMTQNAVNGGFSLLCQAIRTIGVGRSEFVCEIKGYGNIAPKTPWGKVVTIFYAIIGIPLLLLCLSNIGDVMAHSFKFIYWKVCCYLCVRPKKRRKRTTSKPVTIPYRAPIVRPSAGTNMRSTQCNHPVTDSPYLPSSSTYHTAQSSASPTISSSTSTPRHDVNQVQSFLPTMHSNTPNRPITNQHFTHQAQDIAMAPVITNKYALQEDLPIDARPLQLRRKDGCALLAAQNIFTIMKQNNCDGYQYGTHQAYRTNDRYQWKRDRRYMDTDIDMTDEESLRGLTPEPDDEEEVTVPMWLCLALVISYICGGAVLFTFWEKWNFLDSSYFCFVTLTTIGFGDLVPGTAVISDDNQLTLGLCSLYLLFGMALLAMSFNLVQEEVTRSVKCVGKRIGIISDDEDD